VRLSTGSGWLFTLQHGIRFHDSKPATGHAVASLLADAVTDPDELLIHPGFREIDEVSSTGPDEIVLRTKSRRLSLLDELSEVDIGAGSEDHSLGAFRLDQINADGFSATAFKHYYLERASVDRVEFMTFRSQRAAWAAMMRDEIDALYDVNRESVEFVERDSRVRVYPFLRAYPATLFFNVHAPQLRSKAVRVALNQAVDRESIVKHAYRGRGRVADGPLRPEHWAVEKLQPVPSYNPVAAAKAVSVARSSANKQGRLSFRCLVLANAETQPFERIALILQKQLFEIGVDMQLELVPARDLVARLGTGRFEAALFEFNARTPSWLYEFWRSPTEKSEVWIKHGYSAADEELDAMHFAETDDDLRKAAASVYKKMAEDPPAIFIAWPEVTRAASTRFEVPVEPGTDIMGPNMRLWRLAQNRGGRGTQ
jgi:ABC-type transport system substrate-binding protein